MAEHRTPSGDGIQAYLRRIAAIPLLTPDEEVHLGTIVRRWQLSPSPTPTELRSGRRAMDRMVKANLRLVVSVCRYQLREPAGVDLMDLVQAGNIGLIRAVELFDPSRGYRFSTYAYWWIREGISRAICDRSRSIRLPAQVNENLGKLRRAQQELLQRLGHTPSLEDLAEATGLKPLDIRELLFRAQQPLSLDATPVGESDGNLMDKVRCESLSPDDRLAVRSLRDDLEALLGSLPDPESELLRLRYGIQRPEPMSLSAVARQMGVTRDTARGIERRAVAAVRDQCRGVEAYLGA
jgi:RNA polymerase nonessential primary-like sigma factor